jgi:hypothetical protein
MARHKAAMSIQDEFGLSPDDCPVTVYTTRLPHTDDDKPPLEQVVVSGKSGLRQFTRGAEMGCMTEREATRERERLERHNQDKLDREELATARKALTPHEDAIHTLLDELIDAVGDAGADVSYFPHEANMALVEYAKKIAALEVK